MAGLGLEYFGVRAGIVQVRRLDKVYNGQGIEIGHCNANTRRKQIHLSD